VFSSGRCRPGLVIAAPGQGPLQARQGLQAAALAGITCSTELWQAVAEITAGSSVGAVAAAPCNAAASVPAEDDHCLLLSVGRHRISAAAAAAATEKCPLRVAAAAATESAATTSQQ